MTDADKKDFGVAMGVLGFAFGAALDSEMLDAYWHFLRDLALTDFERAVLAAGRSLRWFPKPAELRELAGADAKAAALVAWDAVRAASRTHSYSVSLDFGPLVNAVVRNMGGRNYLCDTPVSQLDVWGKKEFERVYGLLATQDPRGLNGAPLAGDFGGEPVRIAIAGHSASGEIATSGRRQVSAVVRQLAEAKS